jgi:hypothetical protein
MELHQEEEKFDQDFFNEELSEGESEQKERKHGAIRVLAILFVFALYFFIFLKILFIS